MKILISLAILMSLTAVTTGCTTTGSNYRTAHNMGQKATWEVSGVVSRFITTAEGQVDGFILEDGMQIRFPEHMSTAITHGVAVGDMVNVKGFESTTNAMQATQIVTPKNANEIAIVDRARGKLAATKKEREQAYKDLESISVAGEIDTLLHEPSGEVSGFLLTEGSVVRLPVDIRTPTRAYDVGQYVEVTGFGSENKYGKSVEAATVQRQPTEYEIDYE